MKKDINLPTKMLNSLESVQKNIGKNAEKLETAIKWLAMVKNEKSLPEDRMKSLKTFENVSISLEQNEKTLADLLKRWKDIEKPPVYIEKNRVKMIFSKMDKNVAYPIEFKDKTYLIQRPHEGKITIYEVL